jgi:hypothetical protein
MDSRSSRFGRWRRLPIKVALAAVGVVAIVGIASAAIPDAAGVIHGCYGNRTGVLRVINTESNPPQRCLASETALTWNQTGPSGQSGGGPWAVIHSDGTLFNGNGISSVTRNYAGSYTINFNTQIGDGGDKPRCAANVTPTHLDGDTTTVTVINAITYVGSPYTMYVELRLPNAEMVDQSFAIALSC